MNDSLTMLVLFDNEDAANTAIEQMKYVLGFLEPDAEESTLTNLPPGCKWCRCRRARAERQPPARDSRGPAAQARGWDCDGVMTGARNTGTRA